MMYARKDPIVVRSTNADAICRLLLIVLEWFFIEGVVGWQMPSVRREPCVLRSDSTDWARCS